MRSDSLFKTAAALACVLAACGSEPAEPLDGGGFDELEAAIGGVVCPSGASAAVCSGSSDVYTSLFRVGHSATALSDVAQTFTVPRAGLPGRVTLLLRQLKSLDAGASPALTVSVREVLEGVVPTAPSADLASASVAVSTLPRGLPAATEFVLAATNPASPATLQPGRTYAVVVTVEAPATGVAYVGVASHRSAAYGGGQALRRGIGQVSGSFPERPFTGAAGEDDLSFSVTLDDGELVDECALGIDACDANATCTNTAPGYSCACNSGFTGDGFSCTAITLGTFAAPASSATALKTARGPLPDGPYFYAVNGTVRELFTDFSTFDSYPMVLVTRIAANADEQYLTTALNPEDLTVASTTAPVRAAKLSDAELNHVIQAGTIRWTIVGNVSIFYRQADAWTSNFGQSTSCGYTTSYFTGFATPSNTPTWRSFGQYGGACGGGKDGSLAWLVLSGIHANSTTYFGGYSGGSVYRAAPPPAYVTAAPAADNWGQPGYVFLSW